jgi:hypothetical protein
MSLVNCLRTLGLAVVALTASAGQGRAQFDLNLNLSGFSATQRAAVARAEVLWEEIIVGYQPGIARQTLTVFLTVLPIDGPGGMVGVAGPTGAASEGGFVLTTVGAMQIDSADLPLLEADGLVEDLVAHELGHILGIGTQWVANGVYTDGSGAYRGPSGIAAFRTEFDPDATFVPVELSGGPATADGHWDDRLDLLDPAGRPLADELMTGTPSGANYLSNTTIQSLRDIGFEVTGQLSVLVGDVNWDGQVNGLDVPLFVDLLLDGHYLAVADMDNDGQLSGLDVPPFVATLIDAEHQTTNTFVPEPTTLALLLLGLGLIVLRRSPDGSSLGQSAGAGAGEKEGGRSDGVSL